MFSDSPPDRPHPSVCGRAMNLVRVPPYSVELRSRSFWRRAASISETLGSNNNNSSRNNDSNSNRSSSNTAG